MMVPLHALHIEVSYLVVNANLLELMFGNRSAGKLTPNIHSNIHLGAIYYPRRTYIISDVCCPPVIEHLNHRAFPLKRDHPTKAIREKISSRVGLLIY